MATKLTKTAKKKAWVCLKWNDTGHNRAKYNLFDLICQMTGQHTVWSDIERNDWTFNFTERKSMVHVSR